MKILFSCLSRSWGGMEMYTLTQLLELKKNNIEVDLLCFPLSKLHNEAKQLSINIYCIKAKSYFHPIKIFKVKKFIDENKYDAIH
nr:glycosyltransferase family 4 protein [Ignavibacteriaceae bacterium]